MAEVHERLATVDGSARIHRGFGLVTLEVAADRWVSAATALHDRDDLGFGFFDWLSAYEDAGDFIVAAHLWSISGRCAVLLRTRIPSARPQLDSLTSVWAGADWHERETHEMFGIDFPGHANLAPLLLPDGFEGNPLRKDFVLAARRRDWPGALDPDPAVTSGRRRLVPPGAGDPPTPGPA
ncbi:MAG TPA: NADH-quinone oxidoreductase subunit C [Mycobacteriales bacterium]|nr:NADH-quinone oxidoreductase subunit C [Mycobacteriales bacterium]